MFRHLPFITHDDTGNSVNAHAEELRSQFVEHEGKKELVVITSASMSGADFGALARQMSDEIHKNVCMAHLTLG